MPEENGSPKPIQPGAHVRYGPVATMVGSARVEGQMRVVLRVESVTGMHIFLLDHRHAQELAGFLSEAAAAARSGLVVSRKVD